MALFTPAIITLLCPFIASPACASAESPTTHHVHLSPCKAVPRASASEQGQLAALPRSPLASLLRNHYAGGCHTLTLPSPRWHLHRAQRLTFHSSRVNEKILCDGRWASPESSALQAFPSLGTKETPHPATRAPPRPVLDVTVRVPAGGEQAGIKQVLRLGSPQASLGSLGTRF